jgi:GMP synthase (glutamine-hydrolysing)
VSSRLCAKDWQRVNQTLGICLGAQLMAAALGARVYPGDRGSQIGWSPRLPVGGLQPPDWFAPLLADNLSLFHWHGDTFDLPHEALPSPAPAFTKTRHLP